MSLEDDLRRSLQARANDVTPDPETFARVQTRIRRGRSLRLAFVGVATALAVSGIALAAPRLIDRRIEFEPGPVATAPAPDATVSPAVSEPAVGAAPSDTRLVFTDGEGVHAMALDGESAEELIPSPCAPDTDCDLEPLRSVAALATGPDADDITVVAASCGGLEYSVAGAAPEPVDTGTDTCTSSAAFSPSAGHLAWIGQPDPQGTPSLHTVAWGDGGPISSSVGFGLPWDDVSEVSIQDWIWVDDSMRRGELILRGRRNGVIQLLRLPIEQQTDGALATTRRAPPVQARPGFVPLAFAAAGTGVEHTLEARQEPDGYADATIVRRIGTEVVAEIPAPAGMFDGGDFNESHLWMSDNGKAVVFGNAATGKAWYVVYPYDGEGPVPGPTPLEVTIRHGDVILMPPAGMAPATEVPSTTVDVDVYFGREGADACTATDKVTREVEGPGVARGALTELLKGPSSRESNEGFVSPFSANTSEALIGIGISDGVADVDLADFSDVVADDACTKRAIVDALDQTLKQFPTVTSTRYSFDGDVAAWESWLGSDAEHSRLPESVLNTSIAIRQAARDHNWNALRRLSKGTSCSLSDQPEPCVPVWKEQEANGEDPLGLLFETMQATPARYPGTEIWVWSAADDAPDATNSEPRVGIDVNGSWRYYVQEGG